MLYANDPIEGRCIYNINKNKLFYPLKADKRFLICCDPATMATS